MSCVGSYLDRLAMRCPDGMALLSIPLALATLIGIPVALAWLVSLL